VDIKKSSKSAIPKILFRFKRRERADAHTGWRFRCRKSGIKNPDNTPHNQAHQMGSCKGADCPLYDLIVTPMSIGCVALDLSNRPMKWAPTSKNEG
jgi:hypothetical protein